MAEVTFDARGGTRFSGIWAWESPPAFMVMNGDPRKNIDILLDTKSHTLFAIRQGQILRNRLEIVIDETPEERKARLRWVASLFSPATCRAAGLFGQEQIQSLRYKRSFWNRCCRVVARPTKLGRPEQRE